MKHLLIIYSLVFFLILFGQSSHASDGAIDFDSLIPVEQVASELGQNDTQIDKNVLDETQPLHKDENSSEDKKGFWFHHRYPWVYPIPYPYPHPFPVYYPYYYPTPTPAPVVTCYASDAFGTTWSAFSYNAYDAQHAALNQCFTFSNRGCFSRGCTY